MKPNQSYVINLTRRPDRLKRFTEKMKDFPVTIERFEAIDGQTCDVPQRWKRTRSNGSWGIFQSHFGVFKKAYESGAESVLTFEDDAYPILSSDKTKETFEKALDELPNDWEQVYLGYELLDGEKHNPIKYSDHLFIPYKAHRAHAYMLSRKGLVKAIELCERWEKWTNWFQIDHAFHDMHSRQEINVFCVYPALFGQDEGTSDNWDGDSPVFHKYEWGLQ